MAKSNLKKAGRKNAGELEKKKQEINEVIASGDALGNTLIGILEFVTLDWRGFAVAAIGMAKALAALKNTADVEAVNIDELFQSQLTYFEDLFEDITYAEMNK